MEYLPTLGEKLAHSRGNGLVNIPYMDPLGVEYDIGPFAAF